jgi:EamA domain-containing membrane protein RarD
MYNDIVAVIFATVSTAFGILGAGDEGMGSLLPTEMNHNVALLVLAGAIGWAGLLANVKGYQSVSVSAIASIAGYVAVPLGYVIQVFIFAQPIDILSAIGAALIVFTNIYAIAQKHLEQKEEARKLEEGYKPFLDADGPSCWPSKQVQSSEAKKSSEGSCWQACLPLP